ncbi:hypothetical protein BofuT4_uP105570.1 [Botrytis cinerea T4]|uniref:Secreted protein n=1 Tax=Botryotinia fuckeliana (strain T4) TaxID=999810 RepID=G2Y8J2_BOTF4|nr:hypothetical protein BofuT4_uP105570.1 [Botrytis cinerea T4]
MHMVIFDLMTLVFIFVFSKWEVCRCIKIRDGYGRNGIHLESKHSLSSFSLANTNAFRTWCCAHELFSFYL